MQFKTKLKDVRRKCKYHLENMFKIVFKKDLIWTSQMILLSWRISIVYMRMYIGFSIIDFHILKRCSVLLSILMRTGIKSF